VHDPRGVVQWMKSEVWEEKPSVTVTIPSYLTVSAACDWSRYVSQLPLCWQVGEVKASHRMHEAKKAQKIADATRHIQLAGSTQHSELRGVYTTTAESCNGYPMYQQLDGHGWIWHSEAATNWLCHRNHTKVGGTNSLLYWKSLYNEYSPEMSEGGVEEWESKEWHMGSVAVTRAPSLAVRAPPPLPESTLLPPQSQL
jgi:hypothetical protein